MKRGWLDRLLNVLIPNEYAEPFLADLEEERRQLADARGQAYARSWYWGQFTRSLPRMLGLNSGRFSNYLAAALRNLSRNRLYAGINIIGLAVGFAAAILIALFVRDEFSYDKWIPGYERVYAVGEEVHTPGQSIMRAEVTTADVAAELKLSFPSIEAVARLEGAGLQLRHGNFEAIQENSYWADPDFFRVFPMKEVAGDLATALEQPDGIVLTRRIARKYFGRDDPIGETLEVNQKYMMRVAAVIEDLPSNTHLRAEVYASGMAAFSSLTRHDTMEFGKVQPENTYTYFRLKPGASIDALRAAMPVFADRTAVRQDIRRDMDYRFELVPIAALHLRPAGIGPMKPSGDIGEDYALASIAVLAILVASINFVNLMSARAARRAVEVGIRKASGAVRRDLMIQFLGESLIYVMISTILAVALVELLLPGLDAFLQRTITLDYGHDAVLMGSLIVLPLVVGILAGFYPAFVLSAFRPAAVLKGAIVQTAGSGSVRQILVVLQFAILIALIVATGVIYRQIRYATEERLRLNEDQILLVFDGCNGPLKDEVRRLPGVRAASCSSGSALNFGRTGASVKLSDGSQMLVRSAPVDFGLLELYGLRPLAGRFFSEDHPSDGVAGESDSRVNMVVNETTARKLGFSTPELALGQTVTWARSGLDSSFNLIVSKSLPSEIIGVVPDFSLASVRDSVEPTFYYVGPSFPQFLSIKLGGRELPETLSSIDRLWRETGHSAPIQRYFLDQYTHDLYLDVIRQGQVFAVLAVVTVFIACLGLFGLASFTAERRTKEIGIRKAMGARRWDIVKLLVWQFLKPVLLANSIAWPVGYYFMNRWLHGFAYHVDLSPWIFFASGAAALVIALATVSVHAFIVAGARPVTALRYE